MSNTAKKKDLPVLQGKQPELGINDAPTQGQPAGDATDPSKTPGVQENAPDDQHNPPGEENSEENGNDDQANFDFGDGEEKNAIPADLAELNELKSEIPNVDGPAPETIQQNEGNPDQLDNGPENQESQQPAGGDTEKQKVFLSQDHLNMEPLLAKYGFKVGDEASEENGKLYALWLSTLVKVEDLEANDHWQLAGVKEHDTPEELQNKLSAYNDHLEAEKNKKDSGVNTQSPPDSENTNEVDNFFYHGNHLEEHQIGKLNITYDWNEVTSPEHLAFKPTN